MNTQTIQDFFNQHKAIFFVVNLFFIVVLLFGFYISVLLFGKNSLIKLINLREERIILQEMVYKQNLENAQLQKEYFEMQLLEEEKE